MASGRCENCGRLCLWGFEKHKCPPSWIAIDGECGGPDCPEKEFGDDAKEAQLEYAERTYLRFDCPAEMEIWVKKTDADDWIKYEIEVEEVPSFSANLIEGKE